MGLPANETYKDTIEKYRTILRKSPTAYNPGAKPTSGDVSNQMKMMAAERTLSSAQSEELKKRWYGDKPPADETPAKDEGLLSKGLNFLSTPLYAVAGVVETALGKGAKRGLVENIKSNIEERGTFGDIIRGYGANNVIAMPLGFALDVALDPVTWASGGLSLLGKVAKGAKVGSALAMKAAVKGSMAGTAKSAVGLTKLVGEKAGLKSSKLTDIYGSLAKQVGESTSTYEKLTGDTVESALKKSTEAGVNRTRWMDKAYDYLQKSEFGRGANKLFHYSPGGAIKAEKLAADTERASGVSAIRETVVGAKDDVFNAKIGNPLVQNSDDVTTALGKEATETSRLNTELKNTFDEMKVLINDTKLSDKILKLNLEERKQLASVFNYYKSTINSYDKKVAKVLLESPTARKILNSYAILTGMFKSGKIGPSIAAPVNSIFGNAIMTGMIGVNIANTKFLGAMKNAVGIYRGNTEALMDIMRKPEWKDVVEKYPKIFESRLAINPEMVKNSAKYLDDTLNELADKISKGSNMAKVADKEALAQQTIEAMTYVKKAWKDTMAAVNIAPGATPRTYLSEEVLRGPFSDFLNKLKVMGQSENRTLANMAAGFYEKATTGTMGFYSKFDQYYRLGLATHLTENGVTANEVKRLAKRITLRFGDDVTAAKDGLYKFTPMKAMEVADEAYMNYLAMPAFVKIMRTLPLVGSPFISFSYGALSNASKTLMYNPEFYNKVSFLLQEISGEKSPLEKNALDSEYYKWMNKPGMVKVPWPMGENPVYLNMGNMLPYYTMSLLSPSERKYESKYGQEMASVLDKLPVFDDPSGQMLVDYFLMPSLLQDEVPQGSFGQRLYPDKATMAEKIRSLGTSAAEAYLPGYNAPISGFAGLALPESTLPYAPYKARKIGYARKGKTSLGIETKTDPYEKVTHALTGLVGMPTYPVDLVAGKPTKKKNNKQ